MIIPAKIELLQLGEEFLLQCNGAHALPSEGTKPALTWWCTVDSGESDDEICPSSSLASVAPRRVDNLAGWRTGAKIKVPI